MKEEALIKSNIKTLKQELQQTQKEHSEILLLKRELENSVETINNTIGELKKELADIENLIKEREFDNDNLIEKLIQKQSESLRHVIDIEDSVREKISILDDEVALKQQDIQILNEKYESLLYEYNETENKIKTNQRIIENQEKRINILNNKKKSITALIDKTREESHSAYRDKDIVTTSLNQMKKELRDIEHKNEVLLKQEQIVKDNIKKKKILEGDLKVLEDRIIIMKDKNLKVALDDKVNEHRNKK